MCYTGTRTLLEKVINNMNKNLKGSIMVFIAGIAWGLSGVCGQFLMSRGMNVSQLISMRLLISGTVLTAIAATKYRESLVKVLRSKGALVGILLFAVLGFLMNQYSYLVAIDYTNAGTATVLQYMSPIVVLFFVALKERRIPEINEFLAIFCAVLGTFIIVTHGRLDGLAITPKGLVFGLYFLLSQQLFVLFCQQNMSVNMVVSQSLDLGCSWVGQFHFSQRRLGNTHLF